MSILLEALRKSEKRRRGGAVPTIHGDDLPLPEAPQPRWAGERRWLLLAAPVAIAAAWWFWPTDPRDPQPVERAPAARAEAPAARDAPGPADAGAPPMAERPSAPALPTPAAGDDASPPSRPRSPVERLPEAPLTVSAPAPAAAARSDAGAATPKPGAMSGQSAVAAFPGEPDPVFPPTTAPASPGAPPPRAGTEPERRAAERPPIEIWELPRGIRDGLPPLELTVLVYAAEPADRFVLMDGRRLAEGDALGPELSVQEIRRDGAVLRHGAYRFLVRND